MEAVEVVEHHHVEGGRGRALLLVAAHVDVVVVGAPVGETVDQPRIAVVGEDHRPAGREQGVELVVGEPVRVLAVRLQAHQVDDIDDTQPKLGQPLAQDRGRGERLERRHVSGAGEHDVGLDAVVARSPVPDPEAAGAVEHRLLDRQIVQRRLLAGDDHVDVLTRAQGMIGDR